MRTALTEQTKSTTESLRIGLSAFPFSFLVGLAALALGVVATVGVVADVYHVWWDPELYGEIARAAGRLVGFHVSDWLVPMENVLMGRGMMGDGVIELRRIRAAVEGAGYAGPIEVEIFNEEIWRMPLDTLLPLIKERYVTCV